MNRALAGVLLAAAVPTQAQLVIGIPRLQASPVPVIAGAVPSIAAPALSAAPSLMAAPSLAAPLLAAPAPALSSPLQAALAPTAAPAPALIPAAALAEAPSPAPQNGPDRTTVELAALNASRVFDGFGSRGPSEAVPVAPKTVPSAPSEAELGFTRGSFQSADGLEIAYKSRPGPKSQAPRVYSGGLALNESFDPLFAKSAKAPRPEYFMWTRGHRPTGWQDTKVPIDADARDLARMINIAAKQTGSGKVELALHSFGTLVFQRMVQLHEEPEVAQALKHLSGSRVTLLHATTHYEGSERRAGREFEQMGQATRQFVDMLNMMDQAAAAWQAAANLNPFLGPATQFWMAEYRAQRGNLLAMASQGAADMMRKDLAEPWNPAYDSIRPDFIAALKEDARDHGWQESLLRRSSDMFRLEFTKKDVAEIRKLKIHLELIHSTGDQLLNWESARTFFERLGIEAPEKAPAAGAVLTDKSGLFRATIVDGDHYYPLKKRDDLSGRLDP